MRQIKFIILLCMIDHYLIQIILFRIILSPIVLIPISLNSALDNPKIISLRILLSLKSAIVLTVNPFL